MANHPIVHIEIPTIVSKDSAEFYAKTFDWKLEHAPEFDYWMFSAEGGPGGGFIGVGSEADAHLNEPVVYIGTDDLDASLTAVDATAGRTVMSQTEIPGPGRLALVTDPARTSEAPRPPR